VNVDYYGLYSIDPKDVAIHCEILRRFNVFPALVGGINLNNLKDIIRDYGKDIILKVSGRALENFVIENIEFNKHCWIARFGKHLYITLFKLLP
jgi:hypothetical protein